MKLKLSRSFGNVVVNVNAAPAGKSAFGLQKILVPVDFSNCSKKAVQYAIPFAKQFHAAIHFVYVVPIHFHYSDNAIECDTAAITRLQAEAGHKLADLIHEIVPNDVTVDADIRSGVEAAEIVDVAKKSGTDLIILSTHGRTGRAHSLVGSVAEDVVRMAPCPVLVVRERQHEFITGQNAKAGAVAAAK